MACDCANAEKKITAVNLAKLAKLYEIEPDERERLEALRVGADQRDWYHQYAWLFGEDFLRYLGLETGAERLQTYQSSLVRGRCKRPTMPRRSSGAPRRTCG